MPDRYIKTAEVRAKHFSDATIAELKGMGIRYIQPNCRVIRWNLADIERIKAGAKCDAVEVAKEIKQQPRTGSVLKPWLQKYLEMKG